MVTQSYSSVFGVFHAISDQIRREIIDLLGSNEMAAGDIAGRFSVSRPAISRHLRVLRSAGLLNERRAAQSRFYSLNPTPLAQVDRWLAFHRVHWAGRLHDLEPVVDDEELGI